MIEKIFLDGIRALPLQERNFSPGITVFCGHNGCGKTSLLESIFLMSQGFSFRTRDLKSLISWEKQESILRAELSGITTSSTRALRITKDSLTIKKDGEFCRSLASFFGAFPAVMMQPSDIELVRGAPEIRRRWLDEILCFQSDKNANLLRRYRRVLSQRNEWLHGFKQGKAIGGEDVFVVLSQQLVSLGAALWKERFLLAKRLSELIPEYYDRLSNGQDKVHCSYRSAVSEIDSIEEKFFELLEKNEESERRLGITLVGPHKDDFILWLSDYEMRPIGSQGQCRSAAIAMRLSAIDIANSTSLLPILLLDDILAELDSNRRIAVSELIREKKCQVFVATPQVDDLPFSPDDVISLG